MQLDLFKSEIEMLREELHQVKASSDNVRRGLFARHNELSKMYLELKSRMDAWDEELLPKNQPEVLLFKCE